MQNAKCPLRGHYKEKFKMQMQMQMPASPAE
jgi:hypothetical protein